MLPENGQIRKIVYHCPFFALIHIYEPKGKTYNTRPQSFFEWSDNLKPLTLLRWLIAISLISPTRFFFLFWIFEPSTHFRPPTTTETTIDNSSVSRQVASKSRDKRIIHHVLTPCEKRRRNEMATFAHFRQKFQFGRGRKKSSLSLTFCLVNCKGFKIASGITNFGVCVCIRWFIDSHSKRLLFNYHAQCNKQMRRPRQ